MSLCPPVRVLLMSAVGLSLTKAMLRSCHRCMFPSEEVGICNGHIQGSGGKVWQRQGCAEADVSIGAAGGETRG